MRPYLLLPRAGDLSGLFAGVWGSASRGFGGPNRIQGEIRWKFLCAVSLPFKEGQFQRRRKKGPSWDIPPGGWGPIRGFTHWLWDFGLGYPQRLFPTFSHFIGPRVIRLQKAFWEGAQFWGLLVQGRSARIGLGVTPQNFFLFKFWWRGGPLWGLKNRGGETPWVFPKEGGTHFFWAR